MKLDGFGIFVRDMPTMVQFYRDVLGFEIKEEENSVLISAKKVIGIPELLALIVENSLKFLMILE